MPRSPISDEIERLIRLYETGLSEGRTREVQLAGRKCAPLMMHTFLGFELKLGKKRITCPDISTARYLKIFGELGFKSIRIPYDPTRTARILPELERASHRIKELLAAEGLPQQQYRRKLSRIYAAVRNRINSNLD